MLDTTKIPANRELIRTLIGHIKNYGFFSDMIGETICGLPKDVSDKYYNIHTEFEEDPNLPRYDCMGAQIPRGTLYIYGTPIQDSFDYAI